MPPFKSMPPEMVEALLEAARGAAREAVRVIRDDDEKERAS